MADSWFFYLIRGSINPSSPLCLKMHESLLLSPTFRQSSTRSLKPALHVPTPDTTVQQQLVPYSVMVIILPSHPRGQAETPVRFRVWEFIFLILYVQFIFFSLFSSVYYYYFLWFTFSRSPTSTKRPSAPQMPATGACHQHHPARH